VVVVFRDVAALAVEVLVLDEDDRVSSRMAALSSPLASAAVLGTATSRPGTWR